MEKFDQSKKDAQMDMSMEDDQLLAPDRYAYDFDTISDNPTREFLENMIYKMLLPDERFPKSRGEVAGTYARLGLDSGFIKGVWKNVLAQRQLKFLQEERGGLGHKSYAVDEVTFGTLSAFYFHAQPRVITHGEKIRGRWDDVTEKVSESLEGSIFATRIGEPESIDDQPFVISPHAKKLSAGNTREGESGEERPLTESERIPDISALALSRDLQQWNALRLSNFADMLTDDLRDSIELLQHGISAEAIVGIRFSLASHRQQLSEFMPLTDTITLRSIVTNLPDFRKELHDCAMLLKAAEKIYPDVNNLANLFIGSALYAQEKGYTTRGLSKVYSAHDHIKESQVAEDNDPQGVNQNLTRRMEPGSEYSLE